MVSLKFTPVEEKYEPHEFQLEDLEFLNKLDYSANWSEMGTFKTSTGLWWIEKKTEELPAANVLIVTTKSGKGAFFECIPRCLKTDEWKIFNVSSRITEEVILQDLRVESDIDDLIHALMDHDQKVMVLSHYHVFENRSVLKDIFEEGIARNALEWDVVLIDEAHKIKSKDVQWGRNLKKQSKYARFRHAMTGTGFVNNPAELYSILNFLRPDVYTSYWRFRRKYCEEENWTGYAKIVGVRESRIDEFIAMRRSFGPRRRMAEVHKDILEPIFHDVEVELNPTQKRMYKEIVKELRMLDQQGVPIHSPNVVSQLQRLRQIAVATPELVDSYYDPKLDRLVQEVRLTEPSSKLDAVMELLEGMEWDVEARQQVVVFSNFRDPLELLKKRLDEQRDKNGRLLREAIPYIHMEQKDSEQTRFEKWKIQWPKKEEQLFLSTIDLGGESINLSSAQYCIFLDRSWSPAKNLQAVGRIYRPGQKNQAEIIYINAKATVDKRVLDNVTQKVGWFNLLFSDEEG